MCDSLVRIHPLPSLSTDEELSQLTDITMFTRLLFREKKVSVVYHCRPLKLKKGQESVFDRQEKLPDFNQQSLSSSRIILIGGGGLGGEISFGLTRKGVGEIIILDNDIVDTSN